MHVLHRRLLLALVPLALGACATTPLPLREAPEHGPGPDQVRVAPEQYTGTVVRWGGIITAVDNGPADSVVELVSRPLSGNGRPLETDQSEGRFLVHISGFLDPVVYANGRELSVAGRVEGVEQRNIGEYRYSYPVLRAIGHHLWPPRLPPQADPFYYPPYHRPWYPYGPYPWP
ncbi:MAG: Slp family lipoprotein [Pseudomonadota bacterium]